MTIDERIEALAKVLDVFSRGVQELAADLAKEISATRELTEVVRNDHQSILDIINMIGSMIHSHKSTVESQERRLADLIDMIQSHERTVESHERRLVRLEGEK